MKVRVKSTSPGILVTPDPSPANVKRLAEGLVAKDRKCSRCHKFTPAAGLSAAVFTAIDKTLPGIPDGIRYFAAVAVVCSKCAGDLANRDLPDGMRLGPPVFLGFKEAPPGGQQ
jgi:hypothetical protein